MDDLFDASAVRQEPALMPYLMAGYPTLDRSIELLHLAFDSGADVVELGIPFSDPVADGPAIQLAAQRAIEGGTRLRHVLDALESGAPDAPVVLMSYLNPLLAVGRDAVTARMARAGVTGLIVPDLPAEEARPWLAATRRSGIRLIPLMAPTSNRRRVARILERSDGLIYYVSLTGTTGVRQELQHELPETLDRVRAATGRPVAVGFGISSPQHVRRLRGHCDGVVIGSRVIQAIHDGEDVAELLGQFKAATRR